MSVAEIRLVGDFSVCRFKNWICDRAHLLDLKGWVTSQGRESISIVVEGPQALIDAMEMACSLGPMDVLVKRVEVVPRVLNEKVNSFQKF